MCRGKLKRLFSLTFRIKCEGICRCCAMGEGHACNLSHPNRAWQGLEHAAAHCVLAGA